MHRRNRHVIFSAKNAGAIIVLDARTIKGVSDGGTASTWTDMSAKTRVFSGGATYLSRLQGGQPAVRFDATSFTIYTVSWLPAENPSKYVWIGTEIPRTININRHLVSTDNDSFNMVNFSLAHTTTNLVGTNIRSPGVDFYPATVVTGTPYVQSLGYDGTTIFFYRGNYSTNSTQTDYTSTIRITLGGRITGSDRDTSDLMQFLLFNSLVTKSLRRRFEIAAFITFKFQDTQNNTNR